MVALTEAKRSGLTNSCVGARDRRMSIAKEILRLPRDRCPNKDVDMERAQKLSCKLSVPVGA